MNNWVLLELQDDTPIWMHPDDAKKLGFKHGDLVSILNPTSGYKSHPEPLKVTKRIKAGSIFIHHGFGHKTKAWSRGHDKGTSENHFISDGIDPISGAAAFHNGFVQVVKA
jgi:thiosulfate reductase/polysulfide reductase chain A